METHALIPHSGHLPRSVRSVEVRLTDSDPNWLRLRWKIDGAADLVVPAFSGKGFADGLWRTTCFELFVRSAAQGGTGYSEFNFSPSERWAAYDFTAVRTGMTRRDLLREPVATMRQGQQTAIFDVAFPADGLPPRPWAINLTCVIEETGGVLSYWALRHPAGAPDFHDPACFIAAVSPADAA